MSESKVNENMHKSANLRIFRNFLKMSQKDFINNYFADSSGKRLISISKLSMAENGTLSDIDSIIMRVSEQSSVPWEQFGMHPEKFSKYLFRFSGELGSDTVSSDGAAQKSYFETVVKTISDYLNTNILYGKLKPGSKLPPERELAAMFNIKRPMLRDAVKVLTVLGILDVRQGDGIYITNSSTDFYLIPLSWNLILSARADTDIINFRFMLDSEATCLVASAASRVELMEINNVFLKMQTAFDMLDLQNYLNLDMEFHLTIGKAAGNSVLHSSLVTAHQLMRNISAGGLVHKGDIISTHSGHRAIMDAIISGDEDKARAAVNAHRQEALERFLRNRKAGFSVISQDNQTT